MKNDLMIQDEQETMSIYQHEKEMTRMETANKRWFISFLVVLAMLFASNAAWVIYENQFQDVMVTQDADTTGGNNFLNATGEFNYGTREADHQNPGET